MKIIISICFLAAFGCFIAASLHNPEALVKRTALALTGGFNCFVAFLFIIYGKHRG